MTGLAFANESQIEARYILEKANLWRKKSRLDKWQADPRLMDAADTVARKIIRSGNINYSETWTAEILRQLGYSTKNFQTVILKNNRSKDSVLEKLKYSVEIREFLRNKKRLKMGYAYLNSKQSNSISLRVIITAEPTKKAKKSWSKELLKYVNKFRKKYGLPKLKSNILLSRAAQSHADDMAIKDYFSHISPSGKSHGYRAKLQGYKFKDILENIAIGQSTPEEVVEAWKNSKDGHREAMLNSKITEAGFGYRFLPTDGGRIRSYHYWAMSMARPQSLTN